MRRLPRDVTMDLGRFPGGHGLSVIHISAQSDAGPGERRQALDHARRFLIARGAEESEIARIDVPDRGASEGGESVLRPELAALVPMLQSVSLFGGVQGIEVVEAQQIRAGEAPVIAELVAAADPESIAVAFVSFGSIPKVLADAVKTLGEVVAVAKIWERQAQRWLEEELDRRGMKAGNEVVSALVQRFGGDTASLGQALDQLVEVPGKITAEMVFDRFKNRPNEPVFHYTEAVAAGNVAEALRRLQDLLYHRHPLEIVANLETEVRRRSLALVAEGPEHLAKLAGSRPSDGWVQRVWRGRDRIKETSMKRALEALVRADRVFKSQPEDVHQVTAERLTVALCRWMGR